MIKRNFSGTAILVIIYVLAGSLAVSAQSNTLIIKIDDFESDEVGNLPRKWYNQKGERKPIDFEGDLRKTYQYEIREESDNKYLHYEGKQGKHLSFPLVDKNDIDIHKTPILTWRWRIEAIPEGANEDKDAVNDVAASIYVVFDLGHVLFKKVPRSIRYTWSSTLPEGKELSKLFGNQRIIVMGSGTDKIGEWQTFERNIAEDYKRLFGAKPPKKPLAILILSDGDNTNTVSVADYDDIYLKSDQ